MVASLDSVRQKIERANQHIEELKAAVLAFKATDPYKISTKRNPQTRELVYYIVSAEPIPAPIAAILGDILQNLRSVLDHLAYQLFIAAGGDPAKSAHIYFPIFDDISAYKAKSLGKVQGIKQNAIDAIDAIKPYKGGNDTLWLLHKLNNIDKHRLVITVGAAFSEFNIGQHLGAVKVRELLESKGIPLPPQFPDVYMRTRDRMFPLKAGDELFIDAPDAKENEDIKFLCDIAFGEPGISEGESIIETVQGMADLVTQIVFDFKALLA